MTDRVAKLELRVAELRRVHAEYCERGKFHLIPMISMLIEDTENEMLDIEGTPTNVD